MREFIKDADTPELERLRDPAYLPGRQEIFDAFGGELGTDFLQFCFDGRYPIFEFFNREHLQALGGYLAGQILAMHRIFISIPALFHSSVPA